MKRLWLLAIVLGVSPGTGMAHTTDELVNDGTNTDNVITQSMGYDRKSYSPLEQINRSNVNRLVPIWNASLMNDLGELAAPTVLAAATLGWAAAPTAPGSIDLYVS